MFNKLKPKQLLGIFIAGIINSIGVTIFLKPAQLIDSGVSGLSMLLSHNKVLGQYLSLSIFLVIINIPLFLYGLKRQGWVFTIYAIFSVCIYSLSAFFITDVFKIDVTTKSPIAGNDILLCSIFGGLISGVGSGLAIRFGGAMDGIEVLSVIFAKGLGISVGTFVMIFNVILYVVSGVVLGDWVFPLYSILSYIVGSKAVDFIVEGLDRSKSAMIVTDKEQEVCKTLSDTFACGITIMNATGYYSGKSKSVVYIVVNRFQITKLKEIVKMVDPKAYVSISDIADVMKSKKSKTKLQELPEMVGEDGNG